MNCYPETAFIIPILLVGNNTNIKSLFAKSTTNEIIKSPTYVTHPMVIQNCPLTIECYVTPNDMK